MTDKKDKLLEEIEKNVNDTLRSNGQNAGVMIALMWIILLLVNIMLKQDDIDKKPWIA